MTLNSWNTKFKFSTSFFASLICLIYLVVFFYVQQPFLQWNILHDIHFAQANALFSRDWIGPSLGGISNSTGPFYYIFLHFILRFDSDLMTVYWVTVLLFSVSTSLFFHQLGQRLGLSWAILIVSILTSLPIVSDTMTAVLPLSLIFALTPFLLTLSMSERAHSHPMKRVLLILLIGLIFQIHPWTLIFLLLFIFLKSPITKKEKMIYFFIFISLQFPSFFFLNVLQFMRAFFIEFLTLDLIQQPEAGFIALVQTLGPLIVLFIDLARRNWHFNFVNISWLSIFTLLLFHELFTLGHFSVLGLTSALFYYALRDFIPIKFQDRTVGLILLLLPMQFSLMHREELDEKLSKYWQPFEHSTAYQCHNKIKALPLKENFILSSFIQQYPNLGQRLLLLNAQSSFLFHSTAQQRPNLKNIFRPLMKNFDWQKDFIAIEYSPKNCLRSQLKINALLRKQFGLLHHQLLHTYYSQYKSLHFHRYRFSRDLLLLNQFNQVTNLYQPLKKDEGISASSSGHLCVFPQCKIDIKVMKVNDTQLNIHIEGDGLESYFLGSHQYLTLSLERPYVTYHCGSLPYKQILNPSLGLGPLFHSLAPFQHNLLLHCPLEQIKDLKLGFKAGWLRSLDSWKVFSPLAIKEIPILLKE